MVFVGKKRVCVGTARAALYKIWERRGAIYRDQLIGPIKKSAIFITDRLAIYNFKCAHHCCLAHIKRNLNRFAQRTEDDGEWGSQMVERLDHVFHLWREYKTGLRSQRSFQCVSRRYRNLFEYGLLAGAYKSRYGPSLKRFAFFFTKKATEFLGIRDQKWRGPDQQSGRKRSKGDGSMEKNKLWVQK